MNKQKLYLIIGTAVMIIASILTIIILNVTTTNDPYKALFGETIELRNEVDVETYPGGQSFTYIKSQATAYGSDGKKVGDVYDVVIRNGYSLDAANAYGEIELLVGIDRDDKVYVSILKLDQSSWTVLGIKAYVEESYQGVHYEDVDVIAEFDAAAPSAGATATDSTGTIKQAVLNVIYLHYDISLDIYNGVLGETYTIENDTTFTATTHVRAKLNITTSDTLPGGTIYEVTGSGVYYDGQTAAITLWVIFNSDGEIAKILVPESVYGHSKFLITNNNAFLDGFIGDTFTDIDTTIQAFDGQTGATNTRLVMETLLEALVSEVSN